MALHPKHEASDETHCDWIIVLATDAPSLWTMATLPYLSRREIWLQLLIDVIKLTGAGDGSLAIADRAVTGVAGYWGQ